MKKNLIALALAFFVVLSFGGNVNSGVRITTTLYNLLINKISEVG